MVSSNNGKQSGNGSVAQVSEQKVTTTSDTSAEVGKSTFSIMGWIVAGAFLLLFASMVFFDGEDGEELSSSTQEKYDVVQELYDILRPELSEDGQENLDIVMEYIDEDPNVLNLETDEHPAYILDAYAAVQEEVVDAVGSGENPEAGIEVGDEFTVVGTLMQTDETTPYGPLYKVQDQQSGADLYFVFDESQLEAIEEDEMIGEVVEIDIEITDVEGGQVAYYVTGGPSLVSEEAKGSEE